MKKLPYVPLVIPPHMEARVNRIIAKQAAARRHDIDDQSKPSRITTESFQSTGEVSLYISSIRKQHEQIVHRHHVGRRIAIRGWFQDARVIASDPALFARFQADPCVKGLPRPPRSPNDTYRALLQLAVQDLTLASKYYRRTKKFWDDGSSPDRVAKFIDREGIEARKVFRAGGGKASADAGKGPAGLSQAELIIRSPATEIAEKEGLQTVVWKVRLTPHDLTILEAGSVACICVQVEKRDSAGCNLTVIAVSSSIEA